MKTLLFTLASLLLIVSCAQDRIKGNGNVVTETRNIGKFTEIESGGSFDVRIYDAPQNGKLTIEGESNVISAIETTVSGNKLTIKKKNGFNFNSTKGIKITINAQNLNSMGLSGSGSLVADGVQNVDKFTVGMSGSGSMKVKVNAQKTSIGLSGSGDLDIQGKSNSVDIGISGSADVDAADLEAQNVNVGISGSGSTKVWAQKNLKGSVSGSGDIYYKGNPETVDVAASGSGDIEKM